MHQIMIVEDDEYISNMLREALLREGYQVIQAYSGTEALLLLERGAPELVLMDLMLPGLSGEELLPKFTGIPVIVVSAKVEVDDKVRLLLEGAADYVTKPFEMRELLARIAVGLRRGGTEQAPVLRAGALVMDAVSHEVRLSGKLVNLTRTEFAILKLLMVNQGHAVSKSVILERISGDTPDCTDSSLKQHVSNLRKKLRALDGQEYIEAVWGIGFRLCVPEGAG